RYIGSSGGAGSGWTFPCARSSSPPKPAAAVILASSRGSTHSTRTAPEAHASGAVHRIAERFSSDGASTRRPARRARSRDDGGPFLLTSTGVACIVSLGFYRRPPIWLSMPPQNQSEALRGSLDLLVLKTLSLAPMHGWGIGQRIQQITVGELE